MVLPKGSEVFEGTVAKVINIVYGGELQLQRLLDGSTLNGSTNFNSFAPSSVAFLGEPLGFTLLHAAAALKCSAPVISALLEGQSAAATDALGRTPLAVAVEVSGTNGVKGE